MTAPSTAAPLATETVIATLRRTVDQVRYVSTLLRNPLYRVHLIHERVYRFVWGFISNAFRLNIVAPLCYGDAFGPFSDIFFRSPLDSYSKL